MNTKNNKRRRESIKKIENVFMELLETKEIEQITVSDICRIAGINRSTFYANYDDIYDLAEKVKNHLEKSVKDLYSGEIDQGITNHDFVRLFSYIKENRLYFQTYLKFDYANSMFVGYDKNLAREHFDDKHIDYHIEFFKNGFNAIIKLWIKNGCKESPEEIDGILKAEYGRNFR